jgi:hypothetical protein
MIRGLPPLGQTRGRLVLSTTYLVSGILFPLGILGMLKTGFDDLGKASGENFVALTVHPITAFVWMVLGFVGIAMSGTPRRAQAYLAVVGPLFILWLLLSLLFGDDLSQVLVRDGVNMALYLVLGVLSIAAAIAPLPGRLASTFG